MQSRAETGPESDSGPHASAIMCTACIEIRESIRKSQRPDADWKWAVWGGRCLPTRNEEVGTCLVCMVCQARWMYYPRLANEMSGTLFCVWALCYRHKLCPKLQYFCKHIQDSRLGATRWTLLRNCVLLLHWCPVKTIQYLQCPSHSTSAS